MELHQLTALQLGEKIQKKEVSVPEVTQIALNRIDTTQPNYNAYITTLADQAMQQAHQIQERINKKDSLTPLTGVPMGLKDNICTKGIKTTCASKILGDFTPPYQATIAEKLENSGAVLLGKLNMDEFAMGSTSETSYYGTVKNPWNTDCVAGGSSGGSAVAVASQTAWYSIGSDTGGSIRQPASYCGVTGMKPTYGTVSRYGLIAYASSLDQMGPIARSAEDCAGILDIIMGKDKRDGTSLNRDAGNLLSNLTGDIRGKKIGIPTDCFGEGLDEEVRQGVWAVGQVCKERGAIVEEFTLPVMEYVIPTYYIIASAEASSNLSRFDGVKYGWRSETYEDLVDLYEKTRTQGFGSEVKRRILLGTFVLSTGYYDAYYRKALQAKAVIQEAYQKAFERFDCLLTPVAPTTAPKIGESLSNPLAMYLSDIYTVPLNLVGLPGLSMPCGLDSKGMPMGAQLIGPAFGEANLLNVAHGYQMETQFHTQRAKEVL